MARAPKTPKLSTGKASKPELKPLDVHLADLLNPAVNRERAEAAGFAERAQDFIHADLADLGPAPAGGIAETGDGGFGADGVSATVQALTKLLTDGDPRFKDGPPWVPHRPPRPEKSEGGIPFRIQSDFKPAGDQPQAIAELVDGIRRHRARPGAARRHRLRQDLHDGEGHRGDAAPGPDPRAEQDARGAALRRVQELLSRQRRRVFRLLLRLLPARSLRSALGHLYREGILDQRADRPHAPLGDARAARARRRHHRRLRVLHLRHRLGRDLHGDDLLGEGRRADRAAPAHRRSRRPAIQAHPERFRPRHLPRARRRHRAVPGPLRGSRLAHRPVRRRGRIDRRVRSAHRQEVERPEIREGLRQFALRDAAPDAAAGGQGHQGGAEVPRRRS